MAKSKSKSVFPECPPPAHQAPSRWISIDPASGKKPTAVVVWEGIDPVDFRDIDHADYLAVSGTMLDVDLVVMEGGGYVGVNAAASLGLARVRERFATSAWYEDIQYVEVSPTQWRVVLELPTQPRSRAVAGQRDMCNMLSKPRHSPVLPLAHLARNDDRRAALLIGLACCRAWHWTEEQ